MDVASVLDRFYQTTSNEEKRHLEQILNEFKHRPDVLAQCHNVLQTSVHHTSLWFAASTIQEHIQTKWAQVSNEDKDHWRSFLFQLLALRAPEFPTFVCNKVCQCVVVVGRQDWPTHFPTFFQHTTQLLQDQRSVVVGLRLVSMIGEDFSSPNAKGTTTRKKLLREGLAANIRPLYVAVEQVFKTAAEEQNHELCVHCLATLNQLINSDPTCHDLPATFLPLIHQATTSNAHSPNTMTLAPALSLLHDLASKPSLSPALRGPLLSLTLSGFCTPILQNPVLPHGNCRARAVCVCLAVLSHHTQFCITHLPADLQNFLTALFRYTFVAHTQQGGQDDDSTEDVWVLLEAWEEFVDSISPKNEAAPANGVPHTAFMPLLIPLLEALLQHALPSMQDSLCSVLEPPDDDDQEASMVTWEVIEHHVTISGAVRTSSDGAGEETEIDHENNDDDDTAHFRVEPGLRGTHIARVLRLCHRICELFPVEGVACVLTFAHPRLTQYHQLLNGGHPVSALLQQVDTFRMLLEARIAANIIGATCCMGLGEQPEQQQQSITQMATSTFDFLTQTCAALLNNPEPRQNLQPVDHTHSQMLRSLKGFLFFLASHPDPEFSQPRSQSLVELCLATIQNCNALPLSFFACVDVLHATAAVVRPPHLFCSPRFMLATHANTTMTALAHSQTHLFGTLGVCLALCHLALVPPALPQQQQQAGNSAQSQQDLWQERKTFVGHMLAPFITQYTTYAQGAAPHTQQQQQQDVFCNECQITQLFCGLIRCVQFGPKPQKQLVCDVVGPVLPSFVALLAKFKNNVPILEVLMDFMVVTLDALKTNLGPQQVQDLVQRFTGVLSMDALETALKLQNKRAMALYSTFFKMLRVVVEEPHPSFDSFSAFVMGFLSRDVWPVVQDMATTASHILPECIQLVRALLVNKWRFLVSSADGQMLAQMLVKMLVGVTTQPDPESAKLSLQALHDTNQTHRLFSSELVFTQPLMFDTLNTLLRVLCEGWHASVTDLCLTTTTHIALARQSLFYDSFLPQFLGAQTHVQGDVLAVLGNAFAGRPASEHAMASAIAAFVNDLAQHSSTN